METITVMTKKWGNSLGVRLPKEIVRKNNIKSNEKIVIQIGKEKVSRAKELFGILAPKEPIERSMKNIDKALDF